MSTVICTLASLAMMQPAQEPPQLPGVERVVAISGQGYFPVAIRLDDDRIACIMRGGAPHIGIGGRLDLIFSDTSGRSWTEPVTVVDSQWDDRNPGFGQMPDGSLVLGYAECQAYDEEQKWDPSAGAFILKVMRSADGNTWGEPRDLDHPFGSVASPYGRIVTLSDGRSIMSVYGGVTDENRDLFSVGRQDARDACGFLVSTDNGRTWGDFHPVARGYNETSFAEMPSGDLVAVARSDSDQHVAVLVSDDGGRTWSEPEVITLGSQHPADVQLLPSGELLVVYGSRLQPYGIHAVKGLPHELRDAPHYTLTTGSRNWDQGYPSLVLLDHGALAIYYAVGLAGGDADPMTLVARFNPERMHGPDEEGAP
ncbi:MAG: hypothetical protein GF320_00400 [Armatimonadia bacterium]|nr:hypothetical protein [Armatimonadia bacterium]